MFLRLSPNLATFKSRLARRVALWVFGSVVAIEVVLLVPSYQRRQHELIMEQAKTLTSLAGPVAPQQSGQLLPQLSSLQQQNPDIQGIVVLQAEQTLAQMGEPLTAQTVQVMRSGRLAQLPDAQYHHLDAVHRYEIALVMPATSQTIAFRLDRRSLQAKLNAYVWRIVGLVLIISVVVTGTTIYVVAVVVINPLLSLRDDLLEVGDAIHGGHAEFAFHESQENRQDELGELFLAFRSMFNRIQEEVTTRSQMEASLAAETLSTQQAQQQSQELKKVLRELRGTQAQLIHSEKMSSLGQLVAGIAHEFNNPVNFIHANLEPLETYAASLMLLLHAYQDEYPQPSSRIATLTDSMDIEFIQSDLPQLIQSMNNGTQRIRVIVESLRNFSRLDEAVMKYVDIHEGLESTLMLVQHQLKMAGGLITIEKNYAQLPLVECFANQLNQVFMNLLNNAIDALKSLDSPGKIIIQTTQPTLDMVEIWIQDNGPGIVPSNIARIFDPFFTTKPVGQGVGLGLSVSYQIIQMHEGQLICDSTLGQGTTFKIVIPLSQTPVQPLV